METLAFDHVHMYGKSVKSSGKFKVASGGIGWKEASTGLVTTISKDDFDRLSWYRVMRGYQLRLNMKNGSTARFDGFPQECFRNLNEFALASWQIPIENVELSVKGLNWGKAQVENERLNFLIGDKLDFDLSLKEVSNVALSAKDEVAIEFAANENEKKLDSLCEIRFYIPGAPKKDVDDEDIEVEETTGNERENEGEDNEQQEEEEDRANTLFEAIKSATDLDQVTGEIFAELPEMPCIVPRGRYGLEMASTYLRLHGKSYDYKISYSNIIKLFMVPKADDLHVLFVLSLDPPIRQGQTRYPFIVFQFDKDEILELDLKNISEEIIKERYDGKLQIHYEAPTFEVVSTLFRVLAGQKVLVPGSYKGLGGSSCIRCAMKATEGYLYPLERNFLFLPKPTTLIPHADISKVEFSRVGSGIGNPRSFDVKFYLRSGTSYSFSNAPKEDYHALEDFFRQKEIPFTRQEDHSLVSSRRRPDDEDDLGLAKKRIAMDVDEESDDEDYEEESNSSVAEDYDESYESGSGEEDESFDEEDD